MTGSNRVPRDTDALALHPHRMVLWGTVTELAFPEICAHCADPARRRIVVRKTTMIVHDGDKPNTWVDTSPLVPYCEACIVRHCAEVRCIGPALQVRDTQTPGGTALGFAFAASLAGWTAVRELADRQLAGFLGMGAFAFGLGTIAWRLGQRALRVAEYARATSQSSITESFDFIEPEPARWTAQKSVCTMSNTRFAEAFRSLNAALELDPAHPVPPT